jgi:integrase
MTRRAAGEGSIYLEKSTNRWRVKIRQPDGTIRRMNARSQAEALELLKQYRPPGRGSHLTVADCARLWQRASVRRKRGDKAVLSEGYRRWRRTMVEVHIVPALGYYKVEELRLSDVRSLLRGMAERGKAYSTISQAKMVLAEIIDFALAEEMIDRLANVARLAEMPDEIQPSRQKRQAMTLEQAQAFLAAAKGHRLEALFITALMMGLRPGELLGLKWEDIDFTAGTVQIQRALHRHAVPEEDQLGSPKLGPTKTKGSVATLQAPAPVLAALMDHGLKQQIEPGRYKTWVDHGVVFASRRGTPILHENLWSLTQRLSEKAGIGKWTPHEFRHTATSLMLDANVDREEIRRNQRWETMQMLDRYAHDIRPVRGVEAAAAMERIFSGTPADVEGDQP